MNYNYVSYSMLGSMVGPQQTNTLSSTAWSPWHAPLEPNLRFSRDPRLNEDMIAMKLSTLLSNEVFDHYRVQLQPDVVSASDGFTPVFSFMLSRGIIQITVTCNTKMANNWQIGELVFQTCGAFQTQVKETWSFCVSPTGQVMGISSDPFSYDATIVRFTDKVKQKYNKELSHNIENITINNEIPKLPSKESKTMIQLQDAFSKALEKLYNQYYDNIESMGKDIKTKMHFPKYHKIKDTETFFANFDEYFEALIGKSTLKLIRNSRYSRAKAIDAAVATKIGELRTFMSSNWTMPSNIESLEFDVNEHQSGFVINVSAISVGLYAKKFNIIGSFDATNPSSPIDVKFEETPFMSEDPIPPRQS